MVNSMPSFKRRYARRIGTRIRELREARNWSQRDLAGWLDVNASEICRWESGERLPQFHRVLHLADIFEVGFQEIVERVQPAGRADGRGRAPGKTPVGQGESAGPEKAGDRRPERGLGARLRAALGRRDLDRGEAVAVVSEVIFSLLELDERALEALLGAVELIEATSRSVRLKGETRRAP